MENDFACSNCLKIRLWSLAIARQETLGSDDVAERGDYSCTVLVLLCSYCDWRPRSCSITSSGFQPLPRQILSILPLAVIKAVARP